MLVRYNTVHKQLQVIIIIIIITINKNSTVKCQCWREMNVTYLHVPDRSKPVH